MSAEQDRQRSPIDTDSDMPSSALTYASTRPPMSTPGTTPAPSHLPTPRNSSPPPIPLPGAVAADAEASMTGRERRVRKSINYAEPKLNTCVPHVHPPYLTYLTYPQQKDAQTRSSAHVACCETHVLGRLLTRRRHTNGGHGTTT